MNIVTMDGRAFSGTPDQIVRAMRELSFYQGESLRAFVAESAERLCQTGPRVEQPSGETDEELCADFLAKLEAAGAITKAVNGTGAAQ